MWLLVYASCILTSQASMNNEKWRHNKSKKKDGIVERYRISASWHLCSGGCLEHAHCRYQRCRRTFQHARVWHNVCTTSKYRWLDGGEKAVERRAWPWARTWRCGPRGAVSTTPEGTAAVVHWHLPPQRTWQWRLCSWTWSWDGPGAAGWTLVRYLGERHRRNVQVWICNKDNVHAKGTTCGNWEAGNVQGYWLISSQKNKTADGYNLGQAVKLQTPNSACVNNFLYVFHFKRYLWCSKREY